MPLNHLTKLRAATILLAAAVPGQTAHSQTLTQGTQLTVRLDATVSSATAHVGDSVPASLERDLVVRGHTIARRGHPLRGRVTYARSSGRLDNPGYVTVRLDSIEINGKRYRLRSSAIRDEGKGHLRSNATKIGGGAGLGAILGALAGGGRGALIGSLAGAGAGTGLAAATGKHPGELPAESIYTFRLTDSSRPE